MRKFLAVAFLGILLAASTVLIMGRPGGVEAQEADIQIVDYSVETHFPRDVKFYVEVAGPDEIEEVRVYMKTIGQTSRSAYRQVEFEPGNRVSGEAELLTSGNNYVPPGTRLAYSFEVTDKTGRTLRTEDEVFVYLDDRFEWFTVSEGLITVYYNNPLVQNRAEHVLETALKSMAITGPVLGINPELPLHIVTYHSYQDMIGALPFRSQATSERLITQGLAFDKERVLMVHSGDGSVTATTAHEFVHLLVGDALGRAYPQAPAWLNEGLAEYGSRHEGERHILNRRVQNAIDAGTLRPITHLASYSGTPQEILDAYAHGESVVTFMVLEYGEEKLGELMKALARTFDIDAALEQVYGFDQHGLDSAWREAVGLEPLPDPSAGKEDESVPLEAQPTISPILSPTFPPLESATSVPAEAAPAESDPVEPQERAAESSQAAPDGVGNPEPAAGEPEAQAAQPAEEQTSAQPAGSTTRGEENQAAPGDCSGPGMQSGVVGELSLILLMALPVGLVLVRRGGRFTG